MDPIAALTDPAFVESHVLPWTLRLAIALVILLLGNWIARLLTHAVQRLLERSRLDAMLVRFIGNIIYTVLLIMVVIAALDHLGVQTTSLLAVLGAAGLAVGLALKDSLSNFASGVLLIMLRPFKAGDFIQAAGTEGVVEAIHLFSTRMRSPDNREITIPNSAIYGGTIINVTARSTRRVDLVFGIGYDDDIGVARNIINTVIAGDSRILKDPAPAVIVDALADSCVNIAVRVWVNTPDFLAVKSDLIEHVKGAFDAGGITIPYPQRDIHYRDGNKPT